MLSKVVDNGNVVLLEAVWKSTREILLHHEVDQNILFSATPVGQAKLAIGQGCPALSSTPPLREDVRSVRDYHHLQIKAAAGHAIFNCTLALIVSTHPLSSDEDYHITPTSECSRENFTDLL